MQMGDQDTSNNIKHKKNNANVIFINRQEDKLHQEQLTVKFPTKEVQSLIVIGGFTIEGKYLVKGNKIRKGEEKKE